ncbi:MAG: signal peptidase I [Alphaproteobacteria bacterium]
MDFVKMGVLAVLVALGIRTFAFEPFRIPSSSMEPTLLVGDYLLVSKFSYGFSRYSLPFSLPLVSGRIFGEGPKRGDVAVFHPPNDLNVAYIKRVVGLPGDTVQMKVGRLYINGKLVDRRFENVRLARDDLQDKVEFKVYTETLLRSSESNKQTAYKHMLQEFNDDTFIADDTSEIEIPSGHYFMMGDNRDRSSDSRFEVGFVPVENFVGRATRIFNSIDYDGHGWEFWKWPTNIRYSRILDPII